MSCTVVPGYDGADPNIIKKKFLRRNIASQTFFYPGTALSGPESGFLRSCSLGKAPTTRKKEGYRGFLHFLEGHEAG